MNRRNFIGGLLAATAGFAILPGAGRVWKAVVDQRMIVNPEWVNAPYAMDVLFTNRAMLAMGLRTQSIATQALRDELPRYKLEDGVFVEIKKYIGKNYKTIHTRLTGEPPHVELVLAGLE